MKNKGYYFGKIISTLFITIFLISMLIKTTYFLNRIIMLPFLICSITELIKTIFLMLDKTKFIKMCNKIYIISFLTYWFGILGYCCYLSFIDRKYGLLLFSIPFWMIGIYVVKKSFFKSNIETAKNNEKAAKRKLKYNPKIIISSFLVGICFLSGIAMLFFGIKDTYKLNKIAKNYITTNGYFSDYDIYRSDEDGTTYRLTYTYEIDGVNYTIRTDYGTNYIPERNSIREVKYNPENPEESILVGTNSKNGLIYMGAFFTLGSLVFILAAFTILGYFDKFKIDVMGTYFGIVFIIVGIGIILFQNGTTGSLLETVKSFGFWILIPFMFIVVGIFQTVKCCLLSNQNKVHKRN